MYLLFSVFCTPAQGPTFSLPVPFLQLEICLWHSCSAHLPAMNALISPYFNAVPEDSLRVGSWWIVSIFQHHCSWVPGSNHFKGNGKLLCCFQDSPFPFGFWCWFQMMSQAAFFYLCCLGFTNLPASVHMWVPPHWETFQPFCPLLGLWSQPGRCLLIFHSCHLHPTTSLFSEFLISDIVFFSSEISTWFFSRFSAVSTFFLLLQEPGFSHLGTQCWQLLRPCLKTPVCHLGVGLCRLFSPEWAWCPGPLFLVWLGTVS